MGELQDPRAAGDRRGRRAPRRRASPSSRASSSPTATTASATASPTPTPAASPPCSTGSCARSATRSPTSATSACTGPIPAASGGRHNDPSGVEGFPTYAELLERYAARTGRDLSGIDYYVAFSSWRLAVISEGVYARYLHGAMGDQGIGPAELDGMKLGHREPRRRRPGRRPPPALTRRDAYPGTVCGVKPGYVENKDELAKRLRRVEGQVRGIQRMVDEDTYCIDVLTQVSAATKALQSVAMSLLDQHLRHCVADAVQSRRRTSRPSASSPRPAGPSNAW